MLAYMSKLLLLAEAMAVLFSAPLLVFFLCWHNTHEPLHLAWWNFAWTCTFTITPIEYQGHTSKVRVTWVFCVFLCAWYCLNQFAWIHEMLRRHCSLAVLSLEEGLTFLCCLYMTCVSWHCSHAVLSLEQGLTFLCCLYMTCVSWHCSLAVLSLEQGLTFLCCLYMTCVSWHSCYAPMDFNQNFILSAFWDKDEMFMFWGQKIECQRSRRDQICWLRLLVCVWYVLVCIFVFWCQFFHASSAGTLNTTCYTSTTPSVFS